MKPFARFDPYDATHLPDPTPRELASAGIRGDTSLKAAEAAIRVSVTVQPWMKAIADRIVDKHVLPYRSAGELFRALIGNGLRGMVSEIDSNSLSLEVRYADMLRAMYASVLRSRNYRSVARSAYSTARLTIDDNYLDALRTLRMAKRVWLELQLSSCGPSAVVAFDRTLHGGVSPDTPLAWADDPVAVLWHKIRDDQGDQGYDEDDSDQQESESHIHEEAA